MNYFFSPVNIFFLFFLYGTTFCAHGLSSQKVAILGSGYVGLVSGTGLASLGHTVVCVDIDHNKIEALKSGLIPIYEPNLTEMVIQNSENKNLTFSTDIDAALKNADIIIVAVGTPMNNLENEDLFEITRGVNADLSALKKAVISIASSLIDYKIICIKSTVPVGTNQKIKKFIQQICGHDNFDVVSNPEFLREGSALNDFFEKNPIVLGSDSEKALTVMKKLYQPLLDKGRELIKTNFSTAELIKYAWNAFSAIKISYVNELSLLCNKTHADIAQLIFGISFSDKLLPMQNIIPGPGIGGSCLPKDTNAFVSSAEEININLEILKAAIQSDAHHKKNVLADFYKLIDNDPNGKTMSILGLSFKPNTDDIRYSPALMIIEKLLIDGARIRVYDPKAMENMKSLFPDIVYCTSAYDAVKDADALFLLTEWDEFKTLDLEYIAQLMKEPVIMDARNIWSPHIMKSKGFKFCNLGRVE